MDTCVIYWLEKTIGLCVWFILFATFVVWAWLPRFGENPFYPTNWLMELGSFSFSSHYFRKLLWVLFIISNFILGILQFVGVFCCYLNTIVFSSCKLEILNLKFWVVWFRRSYDIKIQHYLTNLSLLLNFFSIFQLVSVISTVINSYFSLLLNPVDCFLLALNNLPYRVPLNAVWRDWLNVMFVLCAWMSWAAN